MAHRSPRLVSAAMAGPGLVALTWDDGTVCAALDLSTSLPSTATNPRVEDWGYTLEFDSTDMDYNSPDLYARTAVKKTETP